MTSSNSSEGKTVTIKRTFKAPRNLVWDAWTQPEHIANWWGPNGMKTTVIEHDFKVGGKWEYVMDTPNGDFKSFGVFSQIEKPESVSSSANFIPMTEGVELIAKFEEAGEETEFTFHVIHESEEYRIQQEKMGIYNGWGSVFTELENYLKRVSA
jgi:uncharacterized protein YndB with AHSA1/START domain